MENCEEAVAGKRSVLVFLLVFFVFTSIFTSIFLVLLVFLLVVFFGFALVCVLVRSARQ